ncbi:hypothetical protein [Inconstantimicrobium mannanitabidum]|uniref:Uncharacterized protein n=1 Tax=Inconstantimicrobium mannanitabidum TaxID=1604901 RepID=A0ACB5RCC0_9CLOT|nr:hypothetical protein [Clostridium sp. TW13]GKX66900.1 hypothetical protein rsdtw13_21580 [Clostridium sp. TW13]
MPRPKSEIDENEIYEIIHLYVIEKLNGIVSKLSNNGVYNFNKQIAQNPKFARKNGELFKLYKYQVWGGQYKGEDGIGKKKIREIKENNTVRVIGENFTPSIIDIIQLVNDLHSKPEKLISRLCKIFERKEKLIGEYESREIKYIKQIAQLKQKLEMMDKGITNLMFQSQSPGNSLNDMFNMTQKEDSICFYELKNIFNNDNERIMGLLELTHSNEDSKNKILKLNSKLNNDKYSRL